MRIPPFIIKNNKADLGEEANNDANSHVGMNFKMHPYPASFGWKEGEYVVNKSGYLLFRFEAYNNTGGGNKLSEEEYS